MSFLQTLGIKPYAQVNDEQAKIYARQLMRKVDAASYSEAQAMLSNASDSNRERMIYGFAASENSVPLAVKWAEQQSGSAMAHVVLGASLIVTGWQIRGGSYADDVDAQAWEPFLGKLKNAQDPLLRAAELDPSMAEPYAWLIQAGIEGDASQQELSQLFAKAVERVPLHFPSHYKHFFGLTQKWGGSHKEMFAFARACDHKAPTGHELHSLIPSAFNELALATYMDSGFDAARKTLRQPAFAKEVAEALYAWLGATSQNLDDKLIRTGGGYSFCLLNEFGAALYMCGAAKEAKEVLIALNGEISSSPWSWIGKGTKERANPAFVYDRACKELGIQMG
jgi:hypothetical protein